MRISDWSSDVCSSDLAYTLPRRVAERDPRAAITVVELDPEVTKAAYLYFGLRSEHGIRSVHGDARAFLSRTDDESEFDRIYVDVYGGQESLQIGRASCRERGCTDV